MTIPFASLTLPPPRFLPLARFSRAGTLARFLLLPGAEAPLRRFRVQQGKAGVAAPGRRPSRTGKIFHLKGGVFFCHVVGQRAAYASYVRPSRLSCASLIPPCRISIGAAVVFQSTYPEPFVHSPPWRVWWRLTVLGGCLFPNRDKGKSIRFLFFQASTPRACDPPHTETVSCRSARSSQACLPAARRTISTRPSSSSSVKTTGRKERRQEVGVTGGLC